MAVSLILSPGLTQPLSYQVARMMQIQGYPTVGFVQAGKVTLYKGPRKAQDILDRVLSSVSSGFYLLRNVPPEQIAPFISHEHPQTIALILSQLDSGQAAGILAQLPEMTQAEVSYRIATMENITPNVLKQIEESLEANLRDGRGKRDIVSNVNFFMNVPVEADGALGIVDGISAPGLTVDLRAEMDVTVVVSNCPQINNPCNGFNPTPVRMIVTA